MATSEPPVTLNWPRRVLVASPHPDDAALSFGGALIHAAASTEILLVTSFGESCWSLDSGADNLWRTCVSARRRAEEHRYADAISARLVMLDYPDASLRGYNAISECRKFSSEPKLAAAIRSDLAALLATFRPQLVVGPAAIGHHIDHRIVRDALVALSAVDAATFVLYEDLPYALWRGGMQGIGRALRVVNIGIKDTLDSKITHLGLYASQIDAQTREAVRRHAYEVGGLTPVERAWIVERAPN